MRARLPASCIETTALYRISSCVNFVIGGLMPSTLVDALPFKFILTSCQRGENDMTNLDYFLGDNSCEQYLFSI